jgi:hypothetical protein
LINRRDMYEGNNAASQKERLKAREQEKQVKQHN